MTSSNGGDLSGGHKVLDSHVPPVFAKEMVIRLFHLNLLTTWLHRTTSTSTFADPLHHFLVCYVPFYNPSLRLIQSNLVSEQLMHLIKVYPNDFRSTATRLLCHVWQLKANFAIPVDRFERLGADRVWIDIMKAVAYRSRKPRNIPVAFGNSAPFDVVAPSASDLPLSKRDC
jgi:hypothetical protein